MPKLQITLQDGTEFTSDLIDGHITIGRVPENTLEISDASVSSRHAELTASNGDYLLKDIGSTNGTRVNGKNITAGEDCPLHDGDVIRFGSVNAVYASEVPSEAKSMPDAQETVAVAATSSVLPADFANASPFQTKKKKKEPAAVAMVALGVLAILVFGGAVYTILSLKPPV